MSKLEPTVSVLMPAYNAAAYIENSIDSILNQTYQDFELIILNDASTDNTFSIIKKKQKKNKRIKVLGNKKNLNIAESRNILVGKAVGKYIAWQDADDISEPNRLKQQVEYLDSHPKVGMVGGYLQFFDEDGPQAIRKYDLSDKELRAKIFRYSPVAQPTAMIRKEALDNVGSYNTSLFVAEDIDMSFRIGTRYSFANIDHITLNYRNHFCSSTYQHIKQIELNTLKIRYSYVFNKNYHFSLFDLVYNVGQLISVWLIPASWKIKIFNYFRNIKYVE